MSAFALLLFSAVVPLDFMACVTKASEPRISSFQPPFFFFFWFKYGRKKNMKPGGSILCIHNTKHKNISVFTHIVKLDSFSPLFLYLFRAPKIAILCYSESKTSSLHHFVMCFFYPAHKCLSITQGFSFLRATNKHEHARSR